MIAAKLDEIIVILDKLIDLTEQDITHIKEAKHDGVAKSVQSKNELIDAFMANKRRFDDELMRLSDNGKNDLTQILSDEDKVKVGEFKKKLRTLQEKNKDYAKLVLAVKNYFDELINTLFDDINGTDNAYGRDKKANLDALFKINV